jgi:hypothetical protein
VRGYLDDVCPRTSQATLYVSDVRVALGVPVDAQGEQTDPVFLAVHGSLLMSGRFSKISTHWL